MAKKITPPGMEKIKPVATATINKEKYTVTCGESDCGYTDKMPSWAVAHGNVELTWICAKCGAVNLINRWW
jgi:hypothetical protein